MNQKKSSVYTEISDFIDVVGTLQTAWWIVVVALLAVAFVILVLTFTKRTNNATKQQIKRFQKDSKYLPALYIELNNSMENLRYFLFRISGNAE